MAISTITSPGTPPFALDLPEEAVIHDLVLVSDTSWSNLWDQSAQLAFLLGGKVGEASLKAAATLKTTATTTAADTVAVVETGAVVSVTGLLLLVGMIFSAGDSRDTSGTADTQPMHNPLSPDQLRCMANPYDTSAECAAVRSAQHAAPQVQTSQDPRAARASAADSNLNATPPTPAPAELPDAETPTTMERGAISMIVPLPIGIMLVDAGGPVDPVDAAALRVLFLGGGILFLAWIATFIAVRPLASAAAEAVLNLRRTGTPADALSKIDISLGSPVEDTWDYSRAVLLFRRAEALWGSNHPGSHDQAMALYQEAKATFEDILRNASNLRVYSPHPNEFLAQIALRQGDLKAAIARYEYLAETDYFPRILEGRADYFSRRAMLLERLAHLYPRTSDYFEKGLNWYWKLHGTYRHLADALPKGSLDQHKALRNSDRTLEEMHRFAEEIFAELLHNPNGSWNDIDQMKELGLLWMPIAAALHHDPSGYVDQLTWHMEVIFDHYESLREDLEELHTRMDGLRAITHPELAGPVLAIMQDWLLQVAQTNGVELHVENPAARARVELAAAEVEARNIAQQLDDPGEFDQAVLKWLAATTQALRRVETPANLEATSSGLAVWISEHPGWGRHFMDILLNNWRIHPELVWRTVEKIGSNHPGWVTPRQQGYIHSWAQENPFARKAAEAMDPF